MRALGLGSDTARAVASVAGNRIFFGEGEDEESRRHGSGVEPRHQEKPWHSWCF
jgi:hypothetical protein